MLHEHMARVGRNRSRSLKWAEKQENFQPKEMCFFLTSTFIEQTGHQPRCCWQNSPYVIKRLNQKTYTP